MYHVPQHHIEWLAGDHHAGLIRARAERRRATRPEPTAGPSPPRAVVDPERRRRRARRAAAVAFAAVLGTGTGPVAVAAQRDDPPAPPSESLIVAHHLRAV